MNADATTAPRSTEGGRTRYSVCGMTVDSPATAHHDAHDGRDCHFCAAGYRTNFVADPVRYLGLPDAPGCEYTSGGYRRAE